MGVLVVEKMKKKKLVMSIGLIWLETYEKDSRTCEKTQYILVEEIRSKSA